MDFRDFEYAVQAMDDINDTLRGVDLDAIELATDTGASVTDAMENLVTVQDVVTAEDMVTLEDVVAELSSLLSRPPEISTIMEELRRSGVESMQDAHAQLLAVHEIATGLTVRIPDAPAINLPFWWPATPEPSEPDPTEPPSLTQEREVPAGPQPPTLTVTPTQKELEELLVRAIAQSKDPLVKLLIIAAATEMFATVVVDGIVYVVGLYFSRC